MCYLARREGQLRKVRSRGWAGTRDGFYSMLYRAGVRAGVEPIPVSEYGAPLDSGATKHRRNRGLCRMHAEVRRASGRAAAGHGVFAEGRKTAPYSRSAERSAPPSSSGLRSALLARLGGFIRVSADNHRWPAQKVVFCGKCGVTRLRAP
jgi:hypothetical protein